MVRLQPVRRNNLTALLQSEPLNIDVTVRTYLDATRASSTPGPMAPDDVSAMETMLVGMVVLQADTISYFIDKAMANEALRPIVQGTVGIDTEYVRRELTGEERIIDEMPTMAAPVKKAGRSAIQYLESIRPGFLPDWDHAGICLIQIAYERQVWVFNLTRMRAFPAELRRILTSPLILKAGAGILSDAAVLWEDVRVEVKNMADVGLMTRLWRAEDNPDDGFNHMALDAAASEAFGVTMDKRYQKGVDWKLDPHEAHITYAALDAVVSLRLYEKLDGELRLANSGGNSTFSTAWYSFNSVMGEATRSRLSVRNADIPWSTKDCTWFAAGKFQGKHY
ncbi:ribonuclease H-like domain-containing protein [Mycena alexandri]|uniref:Ribonuclease H-like domain-containing protein n=1 Tax=Mycena alexandri TaxID=1745969 RepID=A0AAD6SP10_9AGAR|nr:ribonuclease H-like domain-containing protein [Mycena alexandri]